MTRPKVLLLGCGNMANALLSAELVAHFDLYAYSPSGESAKRFVELKGGKLSSTLKQHSDTEFDLLLLFFKPQQLEDVAKQLSDYSIGTQAVLSVLASVEIDRLCEYIPASSFLRLMPNTPSKIGKGVVTSFQHGNHPALELCITELSKIALYVPFKDEKLIDITTPITGSGPAFLFELARIWQSFLVSKGVDPDLARNLVASTFSGSSALLESTTEGLSQLRNEVTSKKGVTEAGLLSLNSRDFEQIVIESFQSCLRRISQLKE